MSSLLTFIGHWHPVVVHLPIGLILGALLLQLLATRPAYTALRPAVPVVLLAGAFSGVISCCTGFILSTSGEYDPTLVGWHQWMAIGLTFFCFYVWSRVRVKGIRADAKDANEKGRGEAGPTKFSRVHTMLSIALFLLVIVTGHLGGSLTHGSDYLSLSPAAAAAAEVDPPIPDVQKARVYAEIVRPILRDNCYSCHGAARQKGGLRLDDSAAIFRGGKDGVVLLPGRGGACEMIKRLLLPVEEEHHMPPREKKQLSERQILLLHWWIDQGAGFSQRVGELKQPDPVRGALLSVQGAKARVVEDEVPVDAADEKDLEALRAKGVLVLPVAQGSHWLEADLSGAGAVNLEMVRLLLPVKKQLLSLKLDHTGVGDSAMAVVGQCVALRSLDLAGTKVSDAGLGLLKGLTELRVLNLVGTGVSAAGVEGLKGLGKLRAIYLYGTKVKGDWAGLKRTFPKAELDTGGVVLPKLGTDTAIVRQGRK